MLYYRQVPNLSQTNLNEIYASQTASIERGGHPDMEFLHLAWVRSRPEVAAQYSSPLVTSHSCPLLDRGVSESLLSNREGSRLISLSRISLGSNQSILRAEHD